MSLLINSAKDINWAIAQEITANGRSYDVSNWIQNFTVPDITLSPVETNFGAGRVKLPGDSPSYSQLSIQFLLDEHWEILTLLYSNLFSASRQSDPKSVYGACTLFAMDTYRIPKFKIEYLNIVPSSVGGFTLNTNMNVTPLTTQVQFEYSQLLFRKLGTSGEYGVGAGLNTTGLYRGEGSPTAETYKNNETYKNYQTRLLQADGQSIPWNIGLLGDDNYTVLYSSEFTPSHEDADQKDPFVNSTLNIISSK